MNKYYTLSLILIIFAGKITAQETIASDTLKKIDEIVVTYQADQRTPVSFLNLNAQDLNTKSTGQEPSFLFSETPSVTNYSDGGNSQGYSYFRIRGIDQTRINMTFDGVPLNEPEDQGAYFSNYPDLLNSVSKIQIQRGVGTTKNGVASYGGSVQLFSANLKDTTKTTFGVGYGSFQSLRVFGEYNSGVKNNKALYVRASQIQSDGYKYHSANNSQSVFLSSGLFRETATWKLNLLAGRQQNDMAWIGVSDALINLDRRTNANTEQEKDKFLQCLAQLQNSWQINASSSLQSSLYYTYLKGGYDFDLNNFIGLPSTTELYRYAVQSHLVGFFSNYNYTQKSFHWTTGLHGNVYNRQHTGSEKFLGQLYQNKGFKEEVSFFSKADYSFKWLHVFADIQYRYTSFDYKGAVHLQKMDWNFINPKAGVSANINTNATLYYSIGSTGREATRNDMFGGNDDLQSDSLGNAVVFNTKPEYVVDHELGFRYQQKKLNFNVNLYYMDFKNEIVLNGKFGPNGLALTNNVDQSIRTGVELSLVFKVNNSFSLINNSSYNYSRIKEQTIAFHPILTPPLIINQEAVYQFKSFTVALSGRYQHNSYMDFANEQTLKSYVLLNSRASYRLNNFEFSLFVNNITNTQYFNQGYVDVDGSKKYFVQAPINYTTSIQYSF